MSQHHKTQKVVFSLAKIFVAQYLEKMHGIGAFQEGAVDLLSQYLIKMIQQLALRVKKLLDMQGRTLANPLHLLAVTQLLNIVDFQALHSYIVKIQDRNYQEFDIIKKLSQNLLGHDIARINGYQQQSQHKNIRYIPAEYTYNIEKQALPYRHPIGQIITKPLQITYRNTRKMIKTRSEGIEMLQAYTKRQMMKGLSAQRHEAMEKKIQRKIAEQKQPKVIILKREVIPNINNNKRQRNQSENRYITDKIDADLKQNIQTNQLDNMQKNKEQKLTQMQMGKINELSSRRNQVTPQNKKTNIESKQLQRTHQNETKYNKPQRLQPPTEDQKGKKNIHNERQSSYQYNPYHRSLVLHEKDSRSSDLSRQNSKIPRQTTKKLKFDMISFL